MFFLRQEDLLHDKEWHIFNSNYETIEEKDFVIMFARRFDSINEKFENIYLIRNERVIKIYDAKGNAFEPDFILFAKQREDTHLTYQVFIEPKGQHLMGTDQWKEHFLKLLRQEKKTINIDSDKYRITAVPFYNTITENEFKKSLEDALTEI